ncbi:MAG: NADP-dependent malic enzyme [Eggerthellaceae bacterium]|nr:NADP-dependent malic enzyme [Eggerthellaceae bacterium]
MGIAEESLEQHGVWRGKIETAPKMAIEDRHDLAVAYTPGVAEPCRAIAADPERAYDYTLKSNTVAVVTDGSAVLGLGNIGPLAALPVMEGKAALFKAFGGVDAFPLCLDTQDTDEIVETCIRLAPAFGGINLEDIAAPRCFEIEARLNDALDIPVFHDDQHGTAIVVLSGVINALRLVGKDAATAKVVVNGAGSAGIAIAKLLVSYGFSDVTLCDIGGIISSASEGINDAQRAMLAVTNPTDAQGTLADAMRGADVVIGVSAPGVISGDMVASMADDAVVFAMANPTPEIFPDEAKAAGARVVGTGRSDFPNQVNNVIAFPGIFRGALEARAERITEEMKLAAARALAALVSDEELCEDFVMPDPFDPRVADAVAGAVRDCALRARGDAE